MADRFRVVDEQVYVLVVDSCEGVLRAALCSQRDVVHVLARLEVAGQVLDRLEGRVRAIALEDDDRRGHGRLEVRAREELGEDVAELFEPRGDLPNLLLRCIADEEEVLRAHARPSVLRLRGVRGVEQKGECEEGKGKAFHKLFFYDGILWSSPRRGKTRCRSRAARCLRL